MDWAGRAELVDPLTSLINDVYAVAELGLWREGATRTTATEMAELVPAGQIAVATRHGRSSAASGCTTSRPARASSGCWSPRRISAARASAGCCSR